MVVLWHQFDSPVPSVVASDKFTSSTTNPPGGVVVMVTHTTNDLSPSPTVTMAGTENAAAEKH